MTPTAALAMIAAAVAAVIHVLFFVLESVLFRTPRGRRLFGVRAEQDSAPLRLFAVNQGVYNLGIAIVVLVGIGLAVAEPLSPVGPAVVIAGCAVMTLAGAALAATAPPRMLPTALAQGVPPLLAIIGLLLA